MFDKKPQRTLTDRLEKVLNAEPVNLPEQAPSVERELHRHPVFRFGIVKTPSLEEVKCIVKDLSSNGAKLAFEGAISLPDKFTLAIEGYAAPTPARLVWHEDTEAGVEFE